MDDTQSSSAVRANCMLCMYLDVCPPGFEVYAILDVSDHLTSEVSAAFLKESITRLIIIGRYLWVELHW